MKTYLYIRKGIDGVSTQLYEAEHQAQRRFVDDYLAELNPTSEAYAAIERALFNEDGNTPTIAEAYNMALAMYQEDDDNGERSSWYHYEKLEVPSSKKVEPDDAEEAAHWDAIRALAKDEHEREGDLEIDEDAVVSEGDDNGAYVQCWKWVEFAGTPLDKEPDA